MTVVEKTTVCEHRWEFLGWLVWSDEEKGIITAPLYVPSGPHRFQVRCLECGILEDHSNAELCPKCLIPMEQVAEEPGYGRHYTHHKCPRCHYFMVRTHTHSL